MSDLEDRCRRARDGVERRLRDSGASPDYARRKAEQTAERIHRKAERGEVTLGDVERKDGSR